MSMLPGGIKHRLLKILYEVYCVRSTFAKENATNLSPQYSSSNMGISESTFTHCLFKQVMKNYITQK